VGVGGGGGGRRGRVGKGGVEGGVVGCGKPEKVVGGKEGEEGGCQHRGTLRFLEFSARLRREASISGC